MAKLDSLTLRLPIIVLAGISIVVIDYLFDLGAFPQGPEFFFIGCGIAIGACLFAYIRAGLHGPAFWFTLAAAYVLVSPLFSYAFGYEWFSDVARKYQTLDAMSLPVLEGALASLILAAAMSALPVSAGGADELQLRLRFGPRTNGLGLILSCVALLFFAWLMEPGPIVLDADLHDLRADRFSDTRFAGGAWALFSVLAVYFYLGIRRVKGAGLILRGIFFASIAASIIYLFLHARRSEILGYMLYVFCVLSPARKGTVVDGRQRRFSIPQIFEMRTVVLVICVAMLAAIGYYRTTQTWQFGKLDYVLAPGAVGNNLLGYVGTFDVEHRTGFGIYPGETYVNQVYDLPPQFMGFYRYPDAYAYLSTKITLMGGQYFLMEPLMNFGGAGIFLYTLLVAVLANFSIRAIRRCLFEDGRLHSYLQGGCYLAAMFRTLWYGPSAAINGAIMALIAGGGLFVISILGGALSKRVYLPTKAKIR